MPQYWLGAASFEGKVFAGVALPDIGLVRPIRVAFSHVDIVNHPATFLGLPEYRDPSNKAEKD